MRCELRRFSYSLSQKPDFARKGRSHADPACSDIRKILLAESPQIITRLIATLILIRGFERPDIVKILLQQFAEMSVISLHTSEHSTCRILDTFCPLEQDQLEETTQGIALRTWDCINDLFQKILALSDLSTLTSKLDRLNPAASVDVVGCPGPCAVPHPEEQYLKDILMGGRRDGESNMKQPTISVLNGLGSHFKRRDRYACLLITRAEIVERTTRWHLKDPECTDILRCGCECGCESMATAHLTLCKYEPVISSYERLVELADVGLGWDDAKT